MIMVNSGREKELGGTRYTTECREYCKSHFAGGFLTLENSSLI